jgi:Tfp pilus assembly protein PilV
MRSKHLLAITLFFASVTLASVATLVAANAGQRHSRWDNSAALAAQRMSNAYAAYAGPLYDDPYWIRNPQLCTYQGGPKTNSWSCPWDR